MVPIAPSRITILLASRSTISNASDWRRLSGIMVRKLLHRESGSAMDRFIYHDWLMGSSDTLTPKEGARRAKPLTRNRPRRRPRPRFGPAATAKRVSTADANQ